MPGLSERSSRLRRASRPLGPAEFPYYLQRPRYESEPAPGWYLLLEEDGAPIYLGASHVDAEIRLVELVRARKVAPAA